MLLCIIKNGCKDQLPESSAEKGRPSVSIVNLKSCVCLLVHLVRQDKPKMSASHVHRMRDTVVALLQNNAVEKDLSLQSTVLELHAEVFENLMHTKEQLQMLTQLVNRAIGNKVTDSEYKLLIDLLKVLLKPAFTAPFANAPEHVSALIYAILEWWPHLFGAKTRAGKIFLFDFFIRSHQRTVEKAVHHLYTLLSCQLFAQLFHQIGHTKHPLEHDLFWAVTSKIMDKSIDAIEACADEDWEVTGLILTARRCALLPIALATLGNAYKTMASLSDKDDCRSIVLDQIPRLLLVTAKVLLKKARGQEKINLLEEISPTALWMFNVRNLAISVVVKFMSVCMSITGTTQREHLIEETLQHPILQLVALEKVSDAATGTVNAAQVSFLAGLTQGSLWRETTDLTTAQIKHAKLGTRMATWCRNTTGVDVLLDPLLRSFFAAAIVRSFDIFFLLH